MKPIDKVFHSKDLNIAYAKGKADERQRILEIIEGFKKGITKSDEVYFLVSELKSKIEGKSK